MSIVIITIPDPVKQEFVRHLQEKTNAVSLVVIQSKPPRVWYHRWRDMIRPSHIFYTLMLRMRPGLRTALAWFRAIPSDPALQSDWHAPTLWTENINHPDTKAQIVAQAPDVVAVWGSGLLHDDTIDAAKHTVNLHLGVAPHYRGALANQFAVGRGDAEHIGYTIHYVNARADAGDIIAARSIAAQEDPRDTFCTVNQKARTHFIDIIERLVTGKTVERRSQQDSAGHVSRMRDWTPQRRYQLATRLLAWRRSGKIPRFPLNAFRDHTDSA